MSHDPYPHERPDPYAADPYANGPFPPNRAAGASPDPGQAPPPPASLPPGAGMPPPYGPYGYPPAPPNTSAIVLTVVSGLTIMTGYCCVIGIAPLILGILGITKNSTDPEGAARLTKIGWIVFAALTVAVLLIIAVVITAMILYEY